MRLSSETHLGFYQSLQMRRAIGLVVLLAVAFGAAAADFRGKVVGVTDGDTIHVLVDGHDRVTVRLAGIDAPEKAQPFGSVSKKYLSEKVFSREVTVESTKRDKYGRVIGRVLADDEDVCMDQVRTGLAWHYKLYASEQSASQRSAYAAAEKQARQEESGLWSQPNPVPPWEFRRSERSARGK